MKDDVPKLFGNLVMGVAKEKLIAKMSKFQIGTKPGHRAQEHLFVLKSTIALHLELDKPVILSTWDVSKFFDSECLIDVMNELHRSDIHGKLYRLLYLMNQNTRIQVCTPVGVTDEADTGETLGQGTVEGAIASAVNLDRGVTEDEIYYLGVKLGPLLFQDDVARLSLSVDSAQSGNTKMRSVAESKLVNFNLEKSGFVVFGSKRRRLELQSELERKPLQLCGKSMSQFSNIKYLGDYLCEEGLAESVHRTVLNRKGMVVRAIYDVKCILKDCRTHITGGLVSGLDIWEVAIIPMLLYNCETWQCISKKTLDELEDLQLRFLRTLLSIGAGFPIPLLFSETGLLSMEFRILERKLAFLHHLHNLPDSSLAKQVLQVQTSQGLPGIFSDCKEFLAKFKIVDLNQYSKI